VVVTVETEPVAGLSRHQSELQDTFGGDRSRQATMPTLEAIKYERGTLQLLDQRLLPMNEVYLDVQSCEDAHRLIRDMAVRGAPAIAVAGVLALAVELHNAGAGDQFASPEEAATRIRDRMEYLVTRCAQRL
jgi:methylthioribose-1-phosphate isomerase